MSKFFKTQDPKKSFLQENLRKKHIEKEKSYKSFLSTEKKKKKFKELIKKSSTKSMNTEQNKNLIKSVDLHENIKHSTPASKIKGKSSRNSHTRSPHALKKNIMKKISMPYKPKNFASIDLQSVKKNIALEEKIENIINKIGKNKIIFETPAQVSTEPEQTQKNINERIRKILFLSDKKVKSGDITDRGENKSNKKSFRTVKSLRYKKSNRYKLFLI